MPIERIELYELTLPLLEPFIISGGTMTERRSLVVVLHDDEGHRGYGESPPFELPFYSEETLVSARDLLERVLIPRVLTAGVRVARGGGPRPSAPGSEATRLPGPRWRPPRGTWRRPAGRRAWPRCWRSAPASSRPRSISCGVALGIPQDRSTETLRRWIDEALARGYRRVKIKVAPGWDAQAGGRLRAHAMAGSGLPLTVDANGGYEWPEHESNLRAARRGRPALHRAAAGTGRAGGPRARWPQELQHADLPGRDPEGCPGRPADRRARWAQGLEHQGAPDGWPARR